MEATSIIKLDSHNCQNCYKCIRECPLKAIEFKDSKVKIIPDECVYCGICVEICPQNAKYVQSNTERVQDLLASGKPVCVSLAPSFVGWNGYNFSQWSAALKKLGFARVEETAIGAAQVSREYAALMAAGQMGNIIATACSSVVMLIERHFPELIKSLAPVSSPMMAHAKLMREAYGDIKVVFVGPCLSKMYESSDPLAGGLINEVLTFEDIEKWMKESGVAFGDADTEAEGMLEPVNRLYPKRGGILDTIPDYGNYMPIAVDGMDQCIEVFEDLRQGKFDHVFIEANICSGSCVGGPMMRRHDKSVIASEIRLDAKAEAIDEHPAVTSTMTFPHPRVFANRAVKNEIPTEEQIREILASIGKTSKEKELNCGSCGYATCRDKAIAVFQGKADITMCMPFLREQAENLYATMIENSPNGIIALDEDMNVSEINPKAEELFGVKRSEILGEMIPALYGETCFEEAKDCAHPVMKKCQGDTEEKLVELTAIYLPGNRMYLAFAKDISEQEANREELKKLRMSTLDVAQNVIEKQMRVAQEIASLLGETTAETKTALTRLKRSITDISEG
jgi:PAS domain S-box-containing protein